MVTKKERDTKRKKVRLTERKTSSKKVFKDSKTVVRIKEHQPAEYVNRFFKDEKEDAEMALFFK